MSATMRTGIGYDLHPLTGGRDLVLGGVHVPHLRGLQGHSDGDVLSHAVADALIGAAGRGDIGQWFPDTDAQYHGANSIGLLGQVAESLRGDGWAVGNDAACIVAHRPRLTGHLAEMPNQIATALRVELAAVNVKATSPEYV